MRSLRSSDPVGLILIESPVCAPVEPALPTDPEATLAGYLAHLARPIMPVEPAGSCRVPTISRAWRWVRRPRRFWSLSDQVPADLGRLTAELDGVCAATRRRLAAG